MPNFYEFLNNMGVDAPTSVTRFYCFAYWIGLFMSGGFFWMSCVIWPPAVTKTGWQEPKNYIRPEELEAPGVLEGAPPDMSSGPGTRSTEGTMATKEAVEMAGIR